MSLAFYCDSSCLAGIECKSYQIKSNQIQSRLHDLLAFVCATIFRRISLLVLWVPTRTCYTKHSTHITVCALHTKHSLSFLKQHLRSVFTPIDSDAFQTGLRTWVDMQSVDNSLHSVAADAADLVVRLFKFKVFSRSNDPAGPSGTRQH